MTDLHTLLRLLPFNVLETLNPEQKTRLQKVLSVGECPPGNGPKTEPLSGPVDLLEIINTTSEPTELLYDPEPEDGKDNDSSQTKSKQRSIKAIVRSIYRPRGYKVD